MAPRELGFTPAADAGQPQRTPGLSHRQPDEFLPGPAFIDYLDAYAIAIDAPVVCNAAVEVVSRTGGGYLIETAAGSWRSCAVVIATGACAEPLTPAMAQQLAASIVQVRPTDYRRPGDLPPGEVLVVGASATGVQLAEEIHASGRNVTLSVGEHNRAPRRYRGADIYQWLDRAGILDDRIDENGNAAATRRQPSLQVVGRPDNRDLDLGTLARQGVRLAGRLVDIDNRRAIFRDDLEASVARSDQRMLSQLRRIDQFIDSRWEGPTPHPEVVEPLDLGPGPATLDLDSAGVRTVVWATGYVRRYPWLRLPLLDHDGELIHRGGATAMPNVYALGLKFMRRRRSSFINGCGHDAEEIASEVARSLKADARHSPATDTGGLAAA